MTILNRNDQSGRSMVEMLGVLAIIGVLSVGGISGYSKAMAKYKLTKAQDQIVMLLMNIRTAYATSPNYSGLTSDKAASYNLAPNEMVSGSGTSAKLYGTFGGEVVVEAVSGATTYFHIKVTNLGKEACRSLGSSDWGADGLVGMWIGSSGSNAAGKSDCSQSGTGTKWCVADLPASLSAVNTACSGEVNSIDWVYY